LRVGSRTTENPASINALTMPAEHSASSVPREYFVDATEAAAFLGINRRTLMKMAREGLLPAHPLGDGARRLWRFLLSELDEWLRGRVNSARRPCSPPRRKSP
jgi:excisionase family DNA binding protein